MILVDGIRTESGLLELTIDIAGDYEGISGYLPDEIPQNSETVMRYGLAVEIQTVPVESPTTPWILFETRRRCHGFKIDARTGKRRISPPEPLVTAEVRKTGVHAESGTGNDDEVFSGSQPVNQHPFFHPIHSFQYSGSTAKVPAMLRYGIQGRSWAAP
jgi:hypothetical protein